VTAILGMGLASGSPSAVSAATLVALHHVLVKGALFLGVGVAAATGWRRVRWPVLGPAAVLSLALGGLPLTGGALAKLSSKAPLGDGPAAVLATLSAAGTTLLMLHFLARLARAVPEDPGARAPAGLVAPWLATAAAAIVVPWALAPTLAGVTGADTLAPSELWAAAWPIALGSALWLVARRATLPAVPEGDVVVLGARLAERAGAFAGALERADARLSQWTVAGVSLLALVILLSTAMLTGP
jgi:formate hydrogenlyase subunit 3/multisubunit Na+/H+ antiporter MnhD subunit